MKSSIAYPVQVHRMLAHLRTPLYRNGYMLMISSGASSALGVVYWILAARFYAPDNVGLNTTIIAAMTFLSSVSLLSLNNVLVRYMPVAGQWTGRLVLWVYGISLTAAVVAALIFLWGISFWAPDLAPLADNAPMMLFWVVALAGSNIFTLQDGALTGLRKTGWIPIENVLFGIAKVVLLVVIAGVMPRYGIYISWVVPLLLAIVPVSYLIFGRLIPTHAHDTRDAQAVPAVSELARYVSGNFVGSTFYFAYASLISLIVVRQVGTAAAAFFYIPWTISSSLNLIALNMSTALTVEAVRDPHHLMLYYKRVVIQCLRLLVPVVILILIGAPYILGVFGSVYAAGTTLFRLVALSVVPGSLVLLYVGVLRAQNRGRSIAVVQGALSMSVLALSTLALPRLGITAVGVAALSSQILIALALLVYESRKWGMRSAGAT